MPVAFTAGIILQGHPGYDPLSLEREYLRDRNWLGYLADSASAHSA
jgi:homoserine trans-succinylase